MFRTIPQELRIPRSMFDRFFVKAGEILNEIKNTNKAQHPLVYHYTTGEGLKGIVESQLIWATHIGFLNDTEEFRDAIRLFVKQIRGQNGFEVENDRAKFVMRVLAEGINENITAEDFHPWFIASFTACQDDLAQWRSYSAGESKFALGFELNHIGAVTHHLSQLSDFRYIIYLAPVVYDPAIKNRTIAEAIKFIAFQYPADEAEAKPSDPEAFAKDWLIYFMQAANMVAPLFKHESFEQEKEWRLIVRPNKLQDVKFRNRGPLLTPFIELDLKGISFESYDKAWTHPLRECWVGPSQYKDANFFSARNLLEKEKLFDIKMLKSDIPYRDI